MRLSLKTLQRFYFLKNKLRKVRTFLMKNVKLVCHQNLRKCHEPIHLKKIAYLLQYTRCQLQLLFYQEMLSSKMLQSLIHQFKMLQSLMHQFKMLRVKSKRLNLVKGLMINQVKMNRIWIGFCQMKLQLTKSKNKYQNNKIKNRTDTKYTHT